MRNQVKKLLYKEKPIAKFCSEKNNIKLYKAKTSLGKVYFKVPLEESDNFGDEIEGQLLIRWLDWYGEVVSSLEKNK